MSFLAISGSKADEPSFLELIAAHRLERGLRESFSYILSVRSLLQGTSARKRLCHVRSIIQSAIGLTNECACKSTSSFLASALDRCTKHCRPWTHCLADSLTCSTGIAAQALQHRGSAALPFCGFCHTGAKQPRAFVGSGSALATRRSTPAAI